MINFFAHVKWFVEENTVDVEPLSGSEIWAAVVIVMAGLGLLLIADKWIEPWLFSKKLRRKLSKYSKYVPDIVRISTGMLLIINYISGYLYAPNLINSGQTSDAAISILLLIAGVLLLAGAYTRLIGAGLVVVYVLSLLTVEPWNDVLDHIEYLGIGLYLFLAQPGKWQLLNLDALSRSTKKMAAAAPNILRVFVGLDLIILAFSEKLANTSDATFFLREHSWNLLSAFGISDRWFIIIAGSVELIVGLSLVLNLATRLTTLTLVGIMITTALLLGVEEIYGHIFAIGVVAVVWLQPYPKKKA